MNSLRNDDQKEKKGLGLIWLQIFFLLFLLILVIVLLVTNQLSSGNAVIIIVLLGLLSIPVYIGVKSRLHPESIATSTKRNNDVSLEGDSNDTFSQVTQLVQENQDEQRMKRKAMNKKLAGLIPLIVIIFCIWYVVFDGNIPFINASPVGRWVQDVDPNSCGSGVTCVTEYWYIVFNTDSTYDIGWKNPGTVEASQGGGTWTQEGSILTMSGTVGGVPSNGQMIIKGNKLYNYYSSGSLSSTYFVKD